jgi:hypothetical protein
MGKVFSARQLQNQPGQKPSSRFRSNTDQVALTSMPMAPQESPELLRELKNHDIAEQASPAQLKQKPPTNQVSPRSRPAAQRADASR